MYEVKVAGGFSAAHKLRNYRGRCEKLHGHNWNVEAAVRVKRLDKTGIAIDFKELKSRLEKVTDTLDHKYLNDLAFFKKVNPTSENIAGFIFERLKKGGLIPSKVSVWESEGTSTTYYG